MKLQVLSWGHCLNRYVIQEGMPLNSLSIQMTLKHISPACITSLNPRLIGNYTLFLKKKNFTPMSNKLSNKCKNKLLLPPPPLYHLTWSFPHFHYSIHPIHPGIIRDSSPFFLCPHFTDQKILAVLPSKDIQIHLLLIIYTGNILV